MAKVCVKFEYRTGLRRKIFRNARLRGTWDDAGRSSPTWSEVAMTEIVCDDGRPGFAATVQFDADQAQTVFSWGVRLDTPVASDVSGIATEVSDANKTDRARTFTLRPAGGRTQVERYYLTFATRFGSRRVFATDTETSSATAAVPGLQFAVWAPNAQEVNVVFGDPANGYIADDGFGEDASRAPLPLTKGADGVWESKILPNFARYEGVPYMYRIKNRQGRVVYRTDIYSRQQIGCGTQDPGGEHFRGGPAALEGNKSCSVVVDVERVAQDFVPVSPKAAVRINEDEFWAREFTPGLPVPTRIEDMVIYELHIGSLGAGSALPGTLQDAMAFLPHLTDLGVNAVELLPMSEFSGVGWGYGDTHHFVLESSAGGRDQYKHFVRECHRRGIAVIQDVVYNHWDANADRAEWAYDSDAPEENIYYWYEGKSPDYHAADGQPFLNGGYLDNGSSGFAPRFWEENVRHVFVSSAAMLTEECHVDGLRVDLTQAMHRDNVLHANGQSVGAANLFGQKTLREWSTTLRLIKPTVVLNAEDHADWAKVTELPENGGLGFGSTWCAAFYHNLVGDSDMAGGRARLLREAGYGDDRALDMGQFASVLYQTKYNKIVYNESHDERGNSGGTVPNLCCAVNNAPLLGATRAVAEARCRVIFGLSLFSAGTPMFFMGEEVGTQKFFKYDTFMSNREDIAALRQGDGAKMFRFYQDAIRFSRRHVAVRVQTIDIVNVNGEGRVIAFRRSAGTDELLVVASLSNHDCDEYVITTEEWRLPDGTWREVFNSDAGLFGGRNVGNMGAGLLATNGRLSLRLPANGLLVLAKV